MASEEQGESPKSASFSEIFDGSEPEVEKASSADENQNESEEIDEKPSEEKTSSSKESERSQESEESERSQKEEKSEEEKPDEPAEKKEEKPADKPEKKEEDKPSQEKDKWESEDNPFVKRWKDTHASWNKEHQQNLQLQSAVQQLQQQLGVMQKKLDGSYDPETDEPKGPGPEEIAANALNVGKTLASRNAAVAQYGEEKLNQMLAEFNEAFGQNQIVQSIVLSSESPVNEAIRILNKAKFEQKYGSEPDAMLKSIKDELRKELEPELKKQITEEIMGRVDKKKKTPQGLSSSRGSSGLESGQNSEGKGPTPLKDLFD